MPSRKIAMLEEIKSKCYRLVSRNFFHPIRNRPYYPFRDQENQQFAKNHPVNEMNRVDLWQIVVGQTCLLYWVSVCIQIQYFPQTWEICGLALSAKIWQKLKYWFSSVVKDKTNKRLWFHNFFSTIIACVLSLNKCNPGERLGCFQTAICIS